jgi:hypothetical protein
MNHPQYCHETFFGDGTYDKELELRWSGLIECEGFFFPGRPGAKSVRKFGDTVSSVLLTLYPQAFKEVHYVSR